MCPAFDVGSIWVLVKLWNILHPTGNDRVELLVGFVFNILFVGLNLTFWLFYVGLLVSLALWSIYMELRHRFVFHANYALYTSFAFLVKFKFMNWFSLA